MLDLILDPGRAARRYGYWRGALIAGSAVALYFMGEVVYHIGQIVAPNLPQPSTLTWVSVALQIAAIVPAAWGAWQLYKDLVHQDWRLEAELYRERGY